MPDLLNKKVNITAKNTRRFPVLNKIYFSTKKYLNENKKYNILKILKVIKVHKLVSFILKHNLRQKGIVPLKKQDINPEFKEKLIKYYKEDTLQLENLTSVDFKEWLS